MKALNIKPPQGFAAYPADSVAIIAARLFDPALDLNKVADIVIADGKIAVIGEMPAGFPGKVIDAAGWIVTPGLFDMHVHLREPGCEYKEDVRSGCSAAAAGGFTGLAAMPNTNPPIDNPALVEMLHERAEGLPVDVVPIASVTQGRQGEALAQLAELHEAGVNGFSDDGSPVASAAVLRLAIEYVKMFDGVVIEHCEELSLTAGKIMDEGGESTALGLPGWPVVAEDIDAYRSIRIAEYTGGRVHIAHVSSAETVRLIREAKARGIKVTAEAAVQHLTLDSRALRGYDTDFKVNPPLRSVKDVEALVEGLNNGTIDAIVTDHAPHAPDEKEVEMVNAPFGMIGLETALGVVLTKLVAEGKITLERAIEAMTAAPRRILGLIPARIKESEPANLTLFDPQAKWTVDRNRFVSKSKNTPYHGVELMGQARGVVNRGMVWIKE